MIENYKKFIWLLNLVFFAVPVFALAQANVADYVPLAPLPLGNGATESLSSYIPAIFTFAIGIGAILAFIMITIGGIRYTTSDAIGNKSEGRKQIENALIGLLLVIGAYVILNTINPQMLNFNLGIGPISIPGPTTGGVTAGGGGGGGNIAGVPMTQDQINADAQVRAELGSSIIAAGPCLQGQTTGCVDLNGLQSQAISGVKTLQSACNCTVTITGGTEPGHTSGGSHGQGTGLDIRADSAITSAITGGQTPQNCQSYSFNGGTYLYEIPGATCGGQVQSSGSTAHWHATF